MSNLHNSICDLRESFNTLRPYANATGLLPEIQTELHDVTISYNQLRMQLQQLHTLWPSAHKRVKRCWINAAGSLLKTVFRSATDTDLQSINSTLLDAQSEIKQNSATIDWHTTRIHGLEKTLLNNTQPLNN